MNWWGLVNFETGVEDNILLANNIDWLGVPVAGIKILSVRLEILQ